MIQHTAGPLFRSPERHGPFEPTTVPQLSFPAAYIRNQAGPKTLPRAPGSYGLCIPGRFRGTTVFREGYRTFF
ncbi:unnamed protein product [Penicillium roqueforti FM164]|uniref:Genomic scaffold, ProqFM164S04 n=1 Tax=Penicillium roqueforti (strain FM164) TaxID=1365484 RepID=W6R219_PENRF|nr:unnamed protein product [Penicillium roqueforti FM164]